MQCLLNICFKKMWSFLSWTSVIIIDKFLIFCSSILLFEHKHYFQGMALNAMFSGYTKPSTSNLIYICVHASSIKLHNMPPLPVVYFSVTMLHGINYLQTIYKYTMLKLYNLKYRKKVCKLNSPDYTGVC